MFDRLKQKGWSLLAIARALKVDPSTIHYWKNKGPSEVQERALASLLDENPQDYGPGGLNV